jgi:membrane associated rhomboid family serine protease
MTPAPVGLRCPDHSGKPQGVARVASAGRTVRVGSSPLTATHVLVGLNVLVYLITVGQGGGINAPGGSLVNDWLLFGPAVADGDWWRLLTSAFLHGSLIHLGMNMLGLWWLGSMVESALGTPRYVLLYLVAGLSGSAGALLLDPLQPTLGASGAIYGILGALLVLEYLSTGSLAGQAMTLIVLNLALTFTIPNISIGGHLGGLAGGIAGTFLLVQFRRSLPLATLGLVGVGTLSVAIAYWKVRGYA